MNRPIDSNAPNLCNTQNSKKQGARDHRTLSRPIRKELQPVQIEDIGFLPHEDFSEKSARPSNSDYSPSCFLKVGTKES